MFFTFTDVAENLTTRVGKIHINGDRIVSFKATANNTTRLCVTSQHNDHVYIIAESEDTVKGMLNSGRTTAEAYAQLPADIAREQEFRRTHITRRAP